MGFAGTVARPTGASGRPHLSVVIPAYNEQRRLPATLSRIAAYLAETSLPAEILVVDDGSSDATSQVASDFLRTRAGRVLRNVENHGKGNAFRRGFLEAAGRWVLITDADLSTPIEEYATLAAEARDHDLDVAFGSRALPASRVEVRQHALRQAMGKTFNRVVRLATGLPWLDTQCGFKLLHRERCLPIVQKMIVDGFAFDVELLFLCARFGLRTREVPVAWRNAEGSSVGVVVDPLRMLVDIARIRWRFRRGLYNPNVSATHSGDAAP